MRDDASGQDSKAEPDCVDFIQNRSPLALRTKDAAPAIGISERTLWALTNSGEIPYCRIGRTIVYPVHLLREWLSEKARAEESQ